MSKTVEYPKCRIRKSSVLSIDSGPAPSVGVTDHPAAGGLDYSALGGKKQKHGSASIGAGVNGCKAPGLKTPNHKNAESDRYRIPKMSSQWARMSLASKMNRRAYSSAVESWLRPLNSFGLSASVSGGMLFLNRYIFILIPIKNCQAETICEICIKLEMLQNILLKIRE